MADTYMVTHREEVDGWAILRSMKWCGSKFVDADGFPRMFDDKGKAKRCASYWRRHGPCVVARVRVTVERIEDAAP